MGKRDRQRDGHLTVYLVWPVASGLLLAAVLAVSVGGVALLAAAPWHQARVWAAGTFFVVLAVVTVGVFLYAAEDWRGDRRPARAPQWPEPEETPEPEIRFVRVGGRPTALTVPAPTQPSAGNQVHRTLTSWAQRLARRTRVTTYAADVGSVEPDAPAWVREMYTVLCRTWPTGDLTRRTFERLFRPGGAALWRRYVNGDGSGRHAGRGILDTWGVIEQSGPRGSWRYAQPLDVIFSLDRELGAYADAMAALSPTGSRAGSGALEGVTPNQTIPKNQTIHHSGVTPEGAITPPGAG